MVTKKGNRTIKAKSNPPENPPTCIEGLRSLLIEITKGSAPIRLGRKSRDALGRILDIRNSADFLSITTLSERIATNPSTITRLAKSLGYSGFGAFQRALLATQLQQPGSFYLNQAQPALAGAEQPVKQRAAQLCRENQTNIDHFINNFEPSNFEKASKLISKAPRVTIYGIRQFHSLAAFLTYGLRMIRSDVSLLNANGLGAAEELGAMNNGDVCIVASVAPYSAQVVDAAQVAHDHGLDVIAITDLASSPLVAPATTSIFARHQSSFLSNSITSYFAVAECLINAVAASNPVQAQQAIVDRQKLIRRLRVEDQTN